MIRAVTSLRQYRVDDRRIPMLPLFSMRPGQSSGDDPTFCAMTSTTQKLCRYYDPDHCVKPADAWSLRQSQPSLSDVGATGKRKPTSDAPFSSIYVSILHCNYS